MKNFQEGIITENEKSLAELVQELQKGNTEAFNEIYNRTYRQAYFTALKICKNEDDAEDVLQEAYMYLLNKAQEIKEPSGFMSGFNMIVANRARNVLRKNNPLLFNDEDEESSLLDSIPDEDGEYHPDSSVEQDELKRYVMELIDGLSDEKRTAVILHYFNEMTTKEIAESLGVNENTVKSRLVQAKKDLAKGVKALESRNIRLQGVAVMPLVIWALRGSSETTATAFIASGAAAKTAAAIKAASSAEAASTAAGTGMAAGASAGATAATTTAGGIAAKLAGLTVVQKIVAGTVAAGIVASGAAGAKTISDRKKAEEALATPTESVGSTVEPTATTLNEENLASSTKETTSTTTTTTTTATTSATDRETSSASPSAIVTEPPTTTTTTTTRTTTRTTTTKRTTLGKATVEIYVLDETHKSTDDYADRKIITIDEGSSFSKSDARAVAGVTTANSFVKSGASVENAQAGKTYTFIIIKA